MKFSTEIEPDKAFPLAVPAKEVTGKTSKMLVCGQRTDILSFRNKPECKGLNFIMVLEHLIAVTLICMS